MFVFLELVVVWFLCDVFVCNLDVFVFLFVFLCFVFTSLLCQPLAFLPLPPTRNLKALVFLPPLP